MEDNLPLLPDKEGTVCADVRSILREVFRHVDNLPSAKLFKGKDDEKLNDADFFAAKDTEWVDTLSSEYGKLHQQEIMLQYEHAKRLARDTPPNQYRLHSPTSSSVQTWKQEAALLRRRDLKPALKQNANCKESLWVKNILNRSSGNVTVVEKTYLPAISNVPHRPFVEGSLQSLSMGEIVIRPAPPTPVVPLPPAAPNHIVPIPSKFHFINFKVGQLHTKCLRLVNISKFELRISVRPPSRRELDIELCSRLVVTSGSAAEMKIHFRPKDVRPFTEQLDVCVSNGQRLCVPISCFMEPPLLQILINNEGSSNPSFSKTIETSNNIIDLGTKLLGDIHRVELLLRCSAEHASFFLLSEDAWIDYTLEYKANQSGAGNDYGIEVDSFFISPVRWSGGDDVKGLAVCRAANIGLQTAALRVISSTAISRQLHLVADTIMFTPKHITIQAHEKDYDICSEDDLSCEYYVNLGVAFPHRSLTETINIRNDSPINYNYYWRSRTWGVCCCWDNLDNLLSDDQSDDDLCPGARETKLKSKKVEETTQSSEKELKEVVVDEPVGCINPYSTVQLTVRAADVGNELGTQRSVLMLVLKDIPKESVTKEDECLILSTKDIAEGTISGDSSESPGRSRQVCEVLCAQIEVWWEVVPVRFTLDPAVLRLPHSRRVKSVTTQIRATQLYGVSNIRANWELLGEPPSPVTLTPEQPTLLTFVLPLSDRTPHTDVIRLTSEGDEWVSSTRIEQCCDTRHPSIKPSFVWLGVFPPGATVTASLAVHNDTHEDISWCATVCRWWGERGVSAACEHRPPCAACHSRACTCSLLTPTRGTLKHSQRDKLMYKVIAPDSDGCVATLVRVHRTDVPTVGSSLDARASLLAYRVLSPHLVLRVLPCEGDKRGTCEGCALDTGDEGTAVLRSRAALVKGGRTCYRLRLTNVTPLPTSGAWEPTLEGEDILKVTFQPNEFEVGGYSEIDITVVVEAKQVTDRRLFIRRASVTHTKKPLYFVIDTAVSGVEVSVEFPTGDKETLSFASFKLIQKYKREPLSVAEPRNDEEIFTEYDLKRKKQQENICYCDHEMVYIPPVKKPELPKDVDDRNHQVEILEDPPPLTRVCPCTARQKPDLPEACEPYCLQFKQVSLRTVISRLVVLRNVSQLDARWRASVRRWPRRHVRTIEKEQWAGDVREPGVVLQCEPSRGNLRACTKTFVEVSVYADCWGLYHDQILIQIENLDPLILDVWIEAAGLPLEFPLRPNDADAQTQPILWFSNTDPERTLLIKNTSRADLLVHAFIVRENECQQDVLPFRLYMRLFDVPRPVCPCVTDQSETSSISEPLIEEMDTSVEPLLTPDHGVQDDTFFQVEPLECLISAGERTSFKLRLLPRHEWAPHTILLLRSTLVKNTGDNWFRPDPPLQFVRLRQIQRTSRLQASCSEISVTLCALDLPCDGVRRVRKRFHLRNVGDDQLDLHSVTEAPWSVDVARQTCAAHCIPNEANKTDDRLKLTLSPSSSTEMIVQVTVRTNEVWPEVDTYSPRSVSSSALCFEDLDGAVLLRIPLILEIEYPVLSLKPDSIDFGDVNDGGTRKCYITVAHSSQSKTIHLVTRWTGDDTFRLWPPTLTLPPGTSARIYIEYTARWLSDSSACGTVHVRAQGVRWCAARALVTARARLCASHSPAHEDYTDDTNLVPRNMLYD